MKKKNILILLLIPFIAALLGVATMNMTFNIVDNDILSIDWEYEDVEGFAISESGYELKAVGVSDSDYPPSEGNKLIWTIQNKDVYDDTVYAEIIQRNGKYYLYAHQTGEVIITCSNQKKNVFRTMRVMIYKGGVILPNPKIGSSQNNIDETIYYGNYDFKYEKGEPVKVAASFELSVKAMPENLSDTIYVKDYSSDIIESFDLKTGIVKIKEGASGDAHITFASTDPTIDNETAYSFNVVKDGVNVYTYNDLLYCTNYSDDGEIVVLRKSFESLKNTFNYDSNGELISNGGVASHKYNNVELFGNYDVKKETFDFEHEVHYFTTTFNQEYIKQWNEFAKTSKNYRDITNQVIAGLRVQKNVYGNGYTINLHNLTFPSEITKVNSNGTEIAVPTLGLNDLFRGPLHFYTLGDPNGTPLVTAFGQDNVGMYIDGDNITINDLNIKNCDFGNMLSNLDTVGTVIDVNGDNVTIENSRLSNGKNVLRVFSCANFKLKNSMLSTSRNFLMQVGTNEYIDMDVETLKTFISLTGSDDAVKIKDYFKKGGNGDTLLNDYLGKSFTPEEQEKMKKALVSIQNALNDKSLIEGQYKGTVVVEDSFFYQSGIASISLDTLFNGPFLLSASPSTITDLFSSMTFESAPLVPLAPVEVSGLSYPVKLELTGSTKFYDYKRTDQIDLSGLINENISTIANQMTDDSGTLEGILGGGTIREITIDDIFPLKKVLLSKASGSLYRVKSEKDDLVYTYINIPIAYYGGGANLSEVDMSNLDMKDEMTGKIEVDLLTEYLGSLQSSSSLLSMMKNLMIKTVTTVIGFEPFNFVCVKGNGYLYGQTPNVEELKKNCKEAKR